MAKGQKRIFLTTLSPEQKKLLKSDYRSCEYIVFDLENTGGNPSRNGITEIAALKVKNGEIIDKFHSLVNPQRRIPPIVRKMTGIDNAMVKDAPKIYEIFPEFKEFVGQGIMVSHNIHGDVSFLRFYSEQVLDEPFDNLFLCTHLLAEKLVPESPSNSLSGLCEFLGFEFDGAHRADVDALMTKKLFEHCLKALEPKKLKTLSEAVRFQGDLESNLRLGWAVSFSKLLRLPKAPGVLVFRNQKNKPIFFTASHNLRTEALRLSKLTRLPKTLMKSLLGAYDIHGEPENHFFDALMSEATMLKKHNIRYSPTQWQNRCMYGFCVKPQQGDLVKVEVGEMDSETTEFWGPLYDVPAGKKLLTALNQKVFEGNANKKNTVRLDEKNLGLLHAVLTGNLKEQKRRAFSKVFNPLRALRAPTKVIDNFKLYRRLKKLHAHKFEVPHVKPLHALSGTLSLKVKGGFETYEVSNAALKRAQTWCDHPLEKRALIWQSVQKNAMWKK